METSRGMFNGITGVLVKMRIAAASIFLSFVDKKPPDYEDVSDKPKTSSFRHGSPEPRLHGRRGLRGIPAIWIPAIHAGMTE